MMRPEFERFEVYDWYDGPLEFSFFFEGQWWTGRLFDFQLTGERWATSYLICPVSGEALESLLSKRLDLRSFYSSQVQVYVSTLLEGWEQNLRVISPLELEESLPESGVFLDWDQEYLHGASF